MSGYRSDFYDVVLVAHILCAIIGFGSVFLNGLYGAEIKKRRGAEGLAIYEANFKVSHVGQYFIYAVFVLGLALVGLSDDTIKFSQTWVWLAMLLYVIALGLSHGVLLPAVKRMGVLMKEMAGGPPPSGGPPPQAVEMGALGKRVGATSGVLDLMLIAILGIMIWKPGF